MFVHSASTGFLTCSAIRLFRFAGLGPGCLGPASLRLGRRTPRNGRRNDRCSLLVLGFLQRLQVPEEVAGADEQACHIDRGDGDRDESDKWLANEAVKAGVELKTALATDLIWETKNGETPRVVGVVTDKGNFEARWSSMPPDSIRSWLGGQGS